MVHLHKQHGKQIHWLLVATLSVKVKHWKQPKYSDTGYWLKTYGIYTTCNKAIKIRKISIKTRCKRIFKSTTAWILHYLLYKKGEKKIYNIYIKYVSADTCKNEDN